MAFRLILLVSMLAIAAPTRAAEVARPPRLAELSQALDSLAATVSPAVVEIQVISVGPPEGASASSGVLAPRRGGGSGVLISADGDIVTNAHVVTGARRIFVTLPASGDKAAPGRSILKPAGRRVDARLVGVDQETDLALLQVETEKAPFLKLGDSDALRPGQVVVTVGSPFGLENSVTMGIVSAVGRQLEPEARMVWIQTDAPINPGNSGGALVNVAGELVGINSMIYSRSGGNEGIGFAAPSNIVRHVVDQLRNFGMVRRGEIGVTAQTITPALAAGLGLDRTWGAILADVDPRGPAHAAGLRPGDIVLELDGKPIENGRQLDVNRDRRAPGSAARVHIMRAGQTRTVSVAVGERESDPGRFIAKVSGSESAVARLGILGLDVSPEVAPLLPWLRERSGVVVAALTPQPPWSEDGGLRPGDVIHRANGQEMTTLAALRAFADSQPAGKTVVLHVNRQGTLRYVTVELD